MPVVVTTSGDGIFGIDTSNLYVAGSTSSGNSFYQVAKTQISAAGKLLIGPLNYAAAAAAIGGYIYWTFSPPGTSTPQPMDQCDVANCTVPTSDWMPGGNKWTTLGSLSPDFISAGVSPCNGTVCWQWFKADKSSAGLYSENYISTSGGTTRYSTPYGAGKYLYWIQSYYDSSNIFQSAVLYSTDYVTTSRAQLAGNLTTDINIIDVNSYSVLLVNATTSVLYRVPLPLGLGIAAPQTVTTVGGTPLGVHATEDANRVYWLDTQGTLSSCSTSSCSTTTKVLANAQTGPSRLFQDDGALYWGRNSPSEIMRLAK